MVATAYYRLEVGLIKRSSGHSSVAKAAYHAGEKIYDERLGETFDFSRKQDVYQAEILAPANAPTWVWNRQELWNAVEQAEKRKDSQVARHFVLSLPNFMSHEEKVAATKDFLRQECVRQGMIADVAWHDFTGPKKHNPHAHVMLSLRTLEKDGFGKKNRGWNQKHLLARWREKWAEHLNHHLAKGGYQERVDHRSYKAQGINRKPMVHEGAAHSALRRDGIKTHLTAHNDNILQGNQEKKQIAQLEAELSALYRQLSAKQREEQSQQVTKKVLASQPQVRTQKKSPPEQLTVEAGERHQQQGEGIQKDDYKTLESSSQKYQERISKDVSQDTTRKNQSDSPYPSLKRRQKDVGTSPLSGSDEELNLSRVKEEEKSQKQYPQGNRPKDPTEYAVRRQLAAMKGDGNFEIGILDAESGKMINKSWHQETILRYDSERRRYPTIAYLKRQNSQGKHIYVRPAPLSNGDSQGLVLVDDLDPIQVEELKDKLKPACVVETSYRNRQVWLKVSNSLNREEATAVAKIIAKEFEGDPGAASYQQYGRLAGFTNRKEDYADKYTGKFPWVRIIEAKGESAANAGAYLERARKQAREALKRRQSAAQKREQLLRQQTNDGECHSALSSFERIRTSARKRYQQYDDSRLDWVSLKRLAKRGYSLPALEYALANGSPDLDKRKKGHVEDYIQRTVQNISQDADVLQALDRRQQRQQKQSKTKQNQESQQYQDKERGDRVDSSRTRQERNQRTEGRKSSFSKGSGQQQPKINKDDIPVHPLGDLDAKAVSWIVERSLKSQTARRQFRNAEYLSTRDTSTWKNQCRAEYLKELGRYLQVKQAEGYSPYTDVEIATKLRMAGFSKRRIYETLRRSSPFICDLDNDAKTRYLAKGIAPLVDNPKVNQKIAQWNQFRVSEALKRPEAQREPYLKEQRLSKLNLSMTKDRWQEQKTQHQVISREHKSKERER